MGALRYVVALLATALLAGGCGSDEPADPAMKRLRDADAVLADRPDDASALANVIRVARAGAGEHVNPDTGRYEPGARPFLDRAAAVWPRYLRATRDRPAAPVAAIAVDVFGNGLSRPRDAADAALLLAEARPSATSWLQVVQWSARGGNSQEAQLAGQRALELADARERDQVRAAIHQYILRGPR